MKNLTLNDYLLIVMVALLAAKKLMALAGWDRGAVVAEELQAALTEAREFIVKARAGDALQVDRAAEVAASKIRGVDAADMKPLIESLVAGAEGTRYGVSVTLDGDGNVRVDPTGLASKLARKAGRWLKKVF